MIQYRHRNCDKNFTPATFAYDIPPAAFFENVFLKGESIINFPFGVTFVHPKDSYCKATGRLYASRELSIKQFNIDSVKLQNKRVHFVMTHQPTKDKYIHISVSVDFNTDKVRVEWVDISDGINWNDY